MVWLITIISGTLLGDLFSGLFHWWEDRYGKTNWPFIGNYVVKPNIAHHKHPADMCQDSYWSHCGVAMLITFPFAILSWYCGLYALAIGFIVLSQANQIHSWSHQKSNSFLRFMQNIGLFLSPKHHAVHHKCPYTQRYCVVTDYLNPFLHFIYFWNILEWFVWVAIGVKPNPEREIY